MFKLTEEMAKRGNEYGWTEELMRKYIETCVPGISYKDMWKIRNQFVYDQFPLEFGVKIYLRRKKIENWEKSKNKNYYKVKMTNGGTKYVFMCEEMVKDFYHTYELAGK